MEPTHTPGPWQWEKVENTQTVPEHTLKGPDVLCRFWYSKPPSPDARLIEAAPELLTVAQGALGYLEALPTEVKPDETWLDPLRKVITRIA